MTSSYSKISTAVILAAGMGIRLRNVTGQIPKGLLEIGGKSLISRSLENLKNEGIDRAVIVTGFQESLYHEHLQPQADIPDLEFIHSKQFEETGSMHSLFVAKNFLQEDFLLLESDLLYESRALPSVINFEGPDVVLASGETGSGDEVYIYGEKSEKQPSNINKGSIVRGEIAAISKKPFPDLSVKGELVGISKISLKLLKLMCDYHEAHLEFPCSRHYEESISELCPRNEILFLRVGDLVWTEIDDQSHYERALKEILPRLI
ncbi:phosphocholine cytidylyltransferase family protein [Deltaproteobacteria bacterium]|nr:phosphocholine cytidylyltransferase family protein [Deltaproteobacteria bacterium]